MIQWLRDFFVRTFAGRWLSTSGSSWRSLASPPSTAVTSAPGPDPDRILLLGGGISVGWGARSHDVALGGHLARIISADTGRGVIMDVVADDVLAGSAPLSPEVMRILRTVDAVIVTPGDIDAILLLPAAVYRRRLESVLDQIADVTPANTRVFVIATVPLTTVLAISAPFRPVASRLGIALDQQARRACQQRDHATFVPFSPAGVAGRSGSGRTYEAWANEIAPTISKRLHSCSDEPTH